MCGISVVVNLDKSEANSDLVSKMNALIHHRGPDDEGIAVNGCVALGHKRLSILDLTAAGHQPMMLDEFTIVFNGEIYNYLELKEELIKVHGQQFITHTDTEVILYAYKIWGKKCIEKFNGMWSLVIHDNKQNELFCSRDRFGIKPLVFTTIGQQFLIGSEIKQFTCHEDFHPKMKQSVAFDYLQHGLLNHTEFTFFEGVKELRGGHNLTLKLETMNHTIEKWYEIDCHSSKLDYHQAQSNFKSLLKESIDLRLRSDVKVGSCLSGGLDSSSIVCFAAKSYPSLITISSCSEDKKYDEQEFIDEVVAHCKVASSKTFPNLDDFFLGDKLETIVYHQDQPITSGSNFSEFKVFEDAAKNNVTVMLDGQGADEYLAGYNEFFVNYWRKLLKKGQILKCYKEIKWHSEKRNRSFFSAVKSLMNFILIYKVRAFIKSFASKSGVVDWLEKESDIDASNRKVKKIFKNIRALSKEQILHSSIPYQLHSEDRNSMYHSIESRLPFMDYRLIEECLSMPDHFKIEKGRTKSILRDSLKEVLPKKIIQRYDKMGFVSADEKWIRDHPEEFRELLEKAVKILEGIVNKNILSHFDRMITKQEGYNNTFIRVVALSKWVKVFDVKLN